MTKLTIAQPGLYWYVDRNRWPLVGNNRARLDVERIKTHF